MATIQRDTARTPPPEYPVIDDAPTISPANPANPDHSIGHEDAPNTRNEKQKSPVDALPRAAAAPKIDVSSGPAMVTPLKQLRKDAQWIDCPFCKRMARTKVTLKEEREEPSGLMMCLVCLVCCPLLLCLPLMTDKTFSWTHACSSCNARVAIVGQNGQVEVKAPVESNLVPSKFGTATQISMPQPVAST